MERSNKSEVIDEKIKLPTEIREDQYKKLRGECWDDALHAFGTSYIYSKRGKKLNNMLKGISFLGMLVPGLVGALVLGYSLESSILTWSLPILTTIGVIQFIFSMLSINNGWNESYAFYVESSAENKRISTAYETLAKYPPNSFEELKAEKEKIDIRNSIRTTEDNKYSLSEKEQRKGMRFALRNYQRKCVGCGKQPISMKSTDCGVCGNF